MTTKVILIIAASCGTWSCITNGDTAQSDTDASGIYVRDYAFEVSNPETGKKIGMRQVRDSIFIERAGNGYQVSNRKWRMNDYDQEGWVSMSHSEDRPLPTFFASYDEQSKALSPENTGIARPIFMDNEKGTLFKDRDKKIGYQKID